MRVSNAVSYLRQLVECWISRFCFSHKSQKTQALGLGKKKLTDLALANPRHDGRGAMRQATEEIKNLIEANDATATRRITEVIGKVDAVMGVLKEQKKITQQIQKEELEYGGSEKVKECESSTEVEEQKAEESDVVRDCDRCVTYRGRVYNFFFS